MAPEGTSEPTADEKRLAELGYSQDLERGWTRFTNFAISFSIISVLAGCFTTFYVAWNNGGPVAISIGWPIIALIILAVASAARSISSSEVSLPGTRITYSVPPSRARKFRFVIPPSSGVASPSGSPKSGERCWTIRTTSSVTLDISPDAT